MTPRQRRQLADLTQMQDVSRDGTINFRAEGDPPELYHLMFSAPGLAVSDDGLLTVRRLHRCRAYLHLDYPRRPPLLTWETPVFHPNLLPPLRNGGVCIGAWSASESLSDLCRRLSDLVAWRSFNTADALDPVAAAWAVDHGVQPGDDVERLAQLPLANDRVVVRVA